MLQSDCTIYPIFQGLLDKMRENGKYFDEHLKDCSDIQLMKNNPKCNSAYWLYTIRVLNGKKHEFMTKMKEVGIMTSQVHNRNDINSCVLKHLRKYCLIWIYWKKSWFVFL